MSSASFQVKSKPLEQLYNKEYFEKGALGGYKHYGQGMKFQISVFLWTRLIAFSLKPHTLLDVGCATGQFVSYFRKLNIQAHGIDISPYAISQVPSEMKNFCHREDVRNLPFNDNEFEVVCSFDVLEHIPERDVLQALSECNRVSRKYMWHKINTGLTEMLHPKPTHFTLRPISWWISQFRTLGLEVKFVFFIPMTWIVVTKKPT